MTHGSALKFAYITQHPPGIACDCVLRYMQRAAWRDVTDPFERVSLKRVPLNRERCRLVGNQTVPCAADELIQTNEIRSAYLCLLSGGKCESNLISNHLMDP